MRRKGERRIHRSLDVGWLRGCKLTHSNGWSGMAWWKGDEDAVGVSVGAAAASCGAGAVVPVPVPVPDDSKLKKYIIKGEREKVMKKLRKSIGQSGRPDGRGRSQSGSGKGVEPIAMTHVLPPHPQLDIRSSDGHNSIQQMDQQSHIDSQQPQQPQSQPTPPQGRKRKKAENGEPSTPAEPRRLRRSHEACARCRSKKIKVGTISRNSSSHGPLARRGKSRRSTPSAISCLSSPT